MAVLLFLWVDLGFSQSSSLRVGFLNGYNLFDTINQPDLLDGDFTPRGRYRWTSQKYWQKISRLSDKLLSMRLDLFGMCEVENRSVVEDLVATMGRDYHIIHYESSDLRGIDLALGYDPSRVEVLESGLIEAPESTSGVRRESLYCRVRFSEGEVCHFILVHLPSRSGGRRARLDREFILADLSRRILSFGSEPLVLMGDFNSTELVEVPSLVNIMGDLYRRGMGSYSYYGVWSLLDQVLVSASLRDRVSTPVLHGERKGLHRGGGSSSSSGVASDHAGVSFVINY